MRLRELISQIGAEDDRLLPTSTKAHPLLRKAEAGLKQWLPAGYLVEAGAGDGKPAITPRIAILNPDETTTTRHGIYVAYLFAGDRSAGKRTVTLTLNQGVTEMAEHLGRSGARLVLALEAATIRAAMRQADLAELDLSFDLCTTAAASVDHEHANIVSRTYRLDSLPGERELVADLQRFVRLYDLARQAREVARRHGRHELIAPVPPPSAEQPEPIKNSQEPDPVTGPVIGVDRKHKRLTGLTGSMTRRGVLAALVAAPIAYVAPRAVASRDQEAAVAQEPAPPPLTAPVFTIDVSQHDWRRRGGNLDWVGIRRGGIGGMCARATYGDPSGYNWPTYHFGDFARAAKHAGMELRGGYHNLVRGDQASINRQVDWLRKELDRYGANWAMLDVERYAELVKADMWPRWEDVRRFDDRWAELESRVLVGYIPPWNWSKYLGQPDLREFRGPLIASNYPLRANDDFKQLYERIGGNGGRGWAAYGSRVPEGWQYSSRAKVPGTSQICDVNAWRLTSEQLKGLLLGRRQAN